MILVGYSYGGPVITGAADRVPRRLAQLVYLEAEVPREGEAEMDPLPPGERSAYEESGNLHRGGRRIPPPLPDPLPPDLDPDMQWARSRMVPHPNTDRHTTAAPDHRCTAFPPAIRAAHQGQGRA